MLEQIGKPDDNDDQGATGQQFSPVKSILKTSSLKKKNNKKKIDFQQERVISFTEIQ